MEYSRNICVELEDFNALLASGHDCDMYLKMSCLFAGLFGGVVIVMADYIVNQSKEIKSLRQVKLSLMEHISALEHELTQAYTNEEEEEEAEKEAVEAEEAEKEAVEAEVVEGVVENTDKDDLDDIHED
jgi:hypothetical protein